MKKYSIVASAILTALASSHSYSAQITGKVVDTNNQPISGAKVHLHGKNHSVITDKFGKFILNTPLFFECKNLARVEDHSKVSFHVTKGVCQLYRTFLCYQ